MKGEKYLFVVSAPSGTGKDTVVGAMLKQHDEVHHTVSATTRAMREGEAEGVNYYYMTREAFESKLAGGEILESNCYCENYYGTLKSEVERYMLAQQPVVLVIDVHGAGNIKRIYPNATTVFMLPPSLEELERRLRSRGTESEESIAKRLKTAQEEMACVAEFDEQVVNHVVEDCAEELYRIICDKIAQEEE